MPLIMSSGKQMYIYIYIYVCMYVCMYVFKIIDGIMYMIGMIHLGRGCGASRLVRDPPASSDQIRRAQTLVIPKLTHRVTLVR